MRISWNGPLRETGTIGVAYDLRQFQQVRDIPALSGLVPQQLSTGGKQTLLRFGKHGGSYIPTPIMLGSGPIDFRPAA